MSLNFYRKPVFLVFFLTFGLYSNGKNTFNPRKESGFETNKGQIKTSQGSPANDVLFRLETKAAQVFVLKSNRIAWQFARSHASSSEATSATEKQAASPKFNKSSWQKSASTVETFRFDIALEGSQEPEAILTETPTEGLTHYASEGIYGVHSYQKLTFRNVYKHIDWIIYLQDEGIKYDFVVHPGGNPADIKIRHDHQGSLWLDKNGALHQRCRLGQVTEDAPISYQGKQQVSSKFILNGNLVQFEIGDYNPQQTLIIDPRRAWGTYFGGSQNDAAYSVSAGQNGEILVTGSTSNNVGIATGGHQTVMSGNSDVFLAKFNRAGHRIWATYYGGTGDEVGLKVITDTTGNIFVGGTTSSTGGIDFGLPATTFSGGMFDGFVARFNANGTLAWGHYLGGNANDDIHSLSLAPNGALYACGPTGSSFGLSTMNAYQYSKSGLSDAFLARFDLSGQLIWATFYGGIMNDYGWEVAAAANGDVYLAGQTYSPANIAFNGFKNTLVGTTFDGFLVKFDQNGTPIWGTYYGDTGFDVANSVIVTDNQKVMIAGMTSSTSGIHSSAQVFQPALAGGFDMFVAQFDSSGQREWGTYLGGAGSEESPFISKGLNGDILVGCNTNSDTLLASNGVQNNYGGMMDGFFAKLNNSGFPYWRSYYGGSMDDMLQDIAADSFGDLIIAGFTESANNISFNGAQQAPAGGRDVFIAKVTDSCISFSGLQARICQGQSFNFNNQNLTQAGTYTRQLPNHLGCDSIIYLTLTVDTIPSKPTITRVGNSLVSSAPTGNQWYHLGTGLISGTTGNTYTPTQPGGGLYWVVSSNSFGCSSAPSDTFAFIGTVVPLSQLANFQFYPNPASEAINVDLPEYTEVPLQLTLLDLSGRLIKRLYEGSGKTLGRNREISLKGIPAGTYLLQLESSGFTTTEKQIIVGQ